MDAKTDDSIATLVAKRGASAVAGARPLTVLQVLPELAVLAGVERGAIEIAGAVAQAGGRAIVASQGGAVAYEVGRAGGVHVELPLKSKSPFVIYKNIGRLQELIAAEKPDIVHARSRAPAWSAYYAAKRMGVPFVTTFHGTYSVGNLFKLRYNAVMTKGARVIAISDFIAGHMRQIYGVPTSKIRIIHRGVDLEKFNPAKVSAERVIQLANKWNLGDGAPVVMLPGRLTRWKGQSLFIDAAERVKNKDAVFVLVGADQGRSAYREELEARAAKLGGRVRLLDNCNDMPAAYMLTDIVVSASLEPEAFGRVIPEAQAMGRPVIAANHGGAKETVIEGETGFLFPPGDADALAAAIDKVLTVRGPAREILAAKAMANIRDHFSSAAMCRKTLAVYAEVLAELPPR
jgi:glycosyltransferase involved in cell wall biosynthesis